MHSEHHPIPCSLRPALELIEAGDLDAALTLAERVAARDPAEPWAWRLQAAALCLMRSQTEAEAAAERAVDLAPEWPASHFILGATLSLGGQWGRAADAFGAALRLRPGWAPAHHRRGEALFRLRRIDEAVAEFRSAHDAMPDCPEAHCNLAVALAGARRWPECQRELAECGARHPDWAPTCCGLLVESGRLEATDEAYSHVHRIKNLVSVLCQRVERYTQRVAPELADKHKGPAERLLAAHQAAFEDVVTTLKAIAVQPLMLEWADMPELISRCLFAASPNIGTRHVITHLAADLPEIYCDVGKIQEAFLSILVNACEATTPDDIITVSAWRGFDTICLAFADSGIGISEEAQRDIFEMGYTTKPYGTGFGLAYAKELLNRHGGGIQVESTPGGGAIFTVELPIKPSLSESLTNLQLRPLPGSDLCALLRDA